MTIKTEYEKFATYLRTLELKFFKGKLYQKATAPHPGATPDHVWIPVESHDEAAPAPGETLTSTSTATGTGTGTGTATGTIPVLDQEVRYGDNGVVQPAPATGPQPSTVLHATSTGTST